MPSYLEIALRAASPARSVPSEPRPDAQAPATPVASQQSPAPTKPRPEVPDARKLAPCDSPDCTGCYEVTPGVRIHPPKCGEDYRAWLERWEAKGRVQ